MIYRIIVIASIVCTFTVFCREYHIANNYLDIGKPKQKNLLYPSFNQCTNADDLRLQGDFPGESTWSPILNQFLFYRFGEPDIIAEEMLFANFFEGQPMSEVIQVFTYWAILYCIMSLIGILVIPFLGAISCFTLGGVLYTLWICFKFVGRNTIITYEIIRRRRERIILPKRHPHHRRKFMMPHIFRNYSDEETPKILEKHTSDESSDSDSDEEERLIQQLLEHAANEGTQVSESLNTLPDPAYETTTATDTETETEKQEVNVTAGALPQKTPNEGPADLEPTKSRRKLDEESATSSGGTSGGYDTGSDIDDQKKMAGKPGSAANKFITFGTQTPAEENLRSPTSKSFVAERKSHHARPKKPALKRKMRRKTHQLDPDENQTKTHHKILKENEKKVKREASVKIEKKNKRKARKNRSPSPSPPHANITDTPHPTTRNPSLQAVSTEQTPPVKKRATQSPRPKTTIPTTPSPSPTQPTGNAVRPNQIRPAVIFPSRPPPPLKTPVRRYPSPGRRSPPPPPAAPVPGATRLRPVPKPGVGRIAPIVVKQKQKQGSATGTGSGSGAGSAESPTSPGKKGGKNASGTTPVISSAEGSTPRGKIQVIRNTVPKTGSTESSSPRENQHRQDSTSTGPGVVSPEIPSPGGKQRGKNDADYAGTISAGLSGNRRGKNYASSGGSPGPRWKQQGTTNNPDSGSAIGSGTGSTESPKPRSASSPNVRKKNR